jgi:hypothetical protein
LSLRAAPRCPAFANVAFSRRRDVLSPSRPSDRVQPDGAVSQVDRALRRAFCRGRHAPSASRVRAAQRVPFLVPRLAAPLPVLPPFTAASSAHQPQKTTQSP